MKYDLSQQNTRRFSVGDLVMGGEKSAYAGRIGRVAEITSPTNTEGEGIERILCVFDVSIMMRNMRQLEKDLQNAIDNYSQLEKVMYRLSVERADTLLLLSSHTPESTGNIYAASCYKNTPQGCTVDTVAVSDDIPTLLRLVWDDARSRSVYMDVGSATIQDSIIYLDCGEIREGGKVGYVVSMEYRISKTPVYLTNNKRMEET